MSQNPSFPHADIDQKKVVVVQTICDAIVRAFESPRLVTMGNLVWLEGSLVSGDRAAVDSGKRSLIRLEHIVALTEFDSLEDYLGGDSGKGRALKMIRRSGPSLA